VKDCQRRS